MTTTINNEHKKHNVPNLRFPEFSGEWKKSTIGKQFDLYSGNTPSRLNKDLFNGKINWISSGELKEHYIHSSKEKISQEASLSLKLLPVGTLVIAIYGLEAEGVRSTGSIIKEPSTISQACMAFSSIGEVENEFLYSWYKKHGNIIGLKYAQGTKQQNLSYDILERFKIAYPCKQEQEKLNKFISLLDERIATQKKIIEDLKKLKSAIIDTKILRNQTAVTIRLSEVCKEAEQIKESTPSFDRIITVRLHANGVHQSNADNLELGATQYYIRKSGQLIYGKQNFHNGAIGIIPESLDGGLTSKDIPSFDIFQDKVNPIYLVCYMQHPSFYEPIEALTTGSGSKRLKERDFLNLQIHLPNKEVQDEIAHSLTVLVSKIDLESRILDLYTKQRSYLLSQMFI